MGKSLIKQSEELIKLAEQLRRELYEKDEKRNNNNNIVKGEEKYARKN